MKKILITLGLVLASLGLQAQVVQPGQTPVQFRTAINDKFDDHEDSIVVARAGRGVLLDSIAEHRTEINAVKIDSLAAHWTVLQALKLDSIPVLRAAIEAAAASMTYPAAGIPLSTGTGWSASITNNSVNWNEAYSAMHDEVTLAGTPDYITISGQTITRNLVDLVNDVTGMLNLDNINALGTPSATTYLRGDGTWSTPSGTAYTFGTGLSETGGTVTADVTYFDNRYVNLADSGKIIWDPLNITTSENAAKDTLWVNIDTTNIATQYDLTQVTGSATLDSTTLTFKDEIEPLFFFNLGRGVAADTSLFEAGAMIDPVFNRSRDTLVVTNITGGARGKSGDTLQYQVMYAPKFGILDATMVPLMEGSPMDLPVGSDGTANVDESVIVNDTIPPDNWVWAQLVSVTADDSITAFASTVSGYKVKGTFDATDVFSSADLTTGLQSVYNLEMASGSAIDQVGSVDLAVSGYPDYQVTGKHNYAVDFLSNTYYFEATSVHEYTEFSISVWAKTTGQAYQSILSNRKLNAQGWYFLSNANDYTLFTVHDGTTAYSVENTTAINTNVWRNYIITYKDGNLRIYADGILEDEATGVPTPTYDVNHFTLGSRGTGIQWLGSIDEVYFWNKELNAAEIAALQTTFYPF